MSCCYLNTTPFGFFWLLPFISYSSVQAELALHCASFHACIFSEKMLLFLKDMLGGQRFQISSAGIHLFQEGGGWSEQAN